MRMLLNLFKTNTTSNGRVTVIVRKNCLESDNEIIFFKENDRKVQIERKS